MREQLQKKSASTDAEFEMQKRYISLLERNCLLEDNSVREEFFGSTNILCMIIIRLWESCTVTDSRVNETNRVFGIEKASP